MRARHMPRVLDIDVIQTHLTPILFRTAIGHVRAGCALVMQDMPADPPQMHPNEGFEENRRICQFAAVLKVVREPTFEDPSLADLNRMGHGLSLRVGARNPTGHPVTAVHAVHRQASPREPFV